MNKKISYLFSFFFFLTSHPLYSLDYNEKIDAEITFISPQKKRILINRGTDDGVEEGDVVKIFKKKLYLGKAVLCVSKNEQSEWIFFGPQNKSPIKDKSIITLIGLFGKNRPKIKNLIAYQNNSILLKKSDESKVPVINKKKTKKAIEHLKIPSSSFNIALSPFSFQIPRDERSIRGEIHYQLDQPQFQFQTLYQYDSFRYYSRDQQSSFSRNKHFNKNAFAIKHFLVDYSTYHLLMFQRITDGNLAVIRYQFSVGPFGILYTYNQEKNTLRSVSFAYIPTFEIYSGDQKDLTKNRNDPSNTTLQLQQSYWRHSFFTTLSFVPRENWKIENQFSYRPYQDFNTGSIDFTDGDLIESIRFSFGLTRKINLSLLEKFSWDKRRQTYLNDSSIEFISALYLELNFNLDAISI